jgi:steroid 5-alpha reductase family enzyme
MLSHFLATLPAAMGLMALCWLISLPLRDVSIVDIFWAPAFAVVGATSAFLSGRWNMRGAVVLILIILWALRLGSHVFARWRRLGHEDYRYAAIRARNGTAFPATSLLWIFGLQGILLWVISWPLQAIFYSRAPLNWLDIVGMLLLIAGICVEAVADAQLSRFRRMAANSHRVLDTGLWAWSRHPNYFGDFLLWWSVFLIAMAAHAPWWTVLGPTVMSALLLHYSGVGLMEETIADRRPEYRAYIRSTSAFVPMPPKRFGTRKHRRVWTG